MKKITIILSMLLCINLTMIGQNVNIPDVNFKSILLGNLTINPNNDGEITISEAAAYTGAITCIDRSVKDLTGIEFFPQIYSLQCNYNSITKIDLSNNTELLVLYCSNNKITSLDLSNNKKLRMLDCEKNDLNYLNIQNGNNEAFNVNSNFPIFDISHNDDLTCVQVDDVSYMNKEHRAGSSYVDAIVNYNTYCEMPEPIKEPLTYQEIVDSIANSMQVDSITTGIEEIESVIVNLYPNPASSNLTIALNESIINIDVFNSAGSLVKSTVKKSFSVDSLSNGVYFIIITTNRGVVQKRFIKN